MKRIFFIACAVVGLHTATANAQGLFTGTPQADWKVVSGTDNLPVDGEAPPANAVLEEMARRQAIAAQFGSTVAYGNFAKESAGGTEKYNRFLEINSEFLDAVWKGDIEQPRFFETADTLLTERKKKKSTLIMKRHCTVKGYAAPIKTIAPAFEYSITNDRGQVVASFSSLRKAGEEEEVSASGFRQGDLFRLRFRSSHSGHLTLYMDNGEIAQRLLPYSTATGEDVRVEADRWYSFFTPSAVPPREADTVDEMELRTDQAVDVFRLYFIFSAEPFTRDFFFLPSDHSSEGRVEIPEGYTRPASVESQHFAAWLQQNRVKRSDLQVAISDLVIENPALNN